jgi:DMSO reductase family type II enzyme chaperone
MPTPSETETQLKGKAQAGSPKNLDWAARGSGARRSVFGNYARVDSRNHPQQPEKTESKETTMASAEPIPLQQAIDSAMARAFLHQFLARAFEDPSIETWAWLTDASTARALRCAAEALGNLQPSAPSLLSRLQVENFQSFQTAYVIAFGHAARGDCPLNEIEYADLKADPLFQPHRLADIAAFYHAFGMEIAADAAERADHLGMELEFMSVLAAKEAYALELQLEADQLQLCRQAQKEFLREHLGRWTPAFARRLARVARDEALAAFADLLAAFVAGECARFGLVPGGEDLVLRPVEEASERLCDSCGLAESLPGMMRNSDAT